MMCTLTGCHEIYDYEGDCDVVYKVGFKFDWNMKYADAFTHEVKEVSLYVLDKDGNVVWDDSEDTETLANDDYMFTVKVPAGEYTLLSWCTTNDDQVYRMNTKARSLEALSCEINTNEKGEVNHRIADLYHGMVTNAKFPDTPGVHKVIVPLIKDTNRIKIVLQHLSGEPVDVNDYEFKIDADNGFMRYDNSVVPGNEVDYYPWAKYAGAAEVDGSAFPTGELNVAVAELTTARLVTQDDSRLSIYAKDTGEKILSVPMKDLILLVKGMEYENMDDQEYLDRQDEYNFVFFLDESDNWLDAYIYINSWKVVLQNNKL